MNLHRFGLKLFLEDSRSISLTEAIPIFHRWIQRDSLQGLWIDVADYSHVPRGPGILLVGHEANLSVDVGPDGRLGLLYLRKVGSGAGLADLVREGLDVLLTAVRLLERETEPGSGFRFRFDEILFFVNDRLQAPRGSGIGAILAETLRPVLEAAYAGGVDLTLEPEDDPRERVAIRVWPKPGVDARALGARLAA